MGIQLGSDFDVIVGLPLDSRLNVADSTARDAIASGVRYEGMVVYVEADELHYTLKGGITNGDWVELSGDALPDQTGNAGRFLSTDGSTASWEPVSASGGSGSKNYFAQEDSNFEGGTVGSWFTLDDGLTASTPYLQATENANAALDTSSTGRETEFTLNNERMVDCEVEVWRESASVLRDFIFSIYEGTVGSLGDLVFQATLTNATLPTAAGTKTTIPINDTAYRTGTFVVVLTQAAVAAPGFNVIVKYNFASPIFRFQGDITAQQQASSTVLDIDVTTNSLAGTNSLLVTKTAADGEDHSFRCALATIDEIDRGNILFASLVYDLSQETNYTSGDIELQVWDTTFDLQVQLYTGPDALELLKTKGRFDFPIYTETITEQIEVRAYCRTASTSAWTNIRFDEFKLGPAAQVQTVYRKSATIDLTGSGNFTAGTIQVERVANSVVIKNLSNITFASNSAPASASGIIPDWARPETDAHNASRGSSTIQETQVSSGGTLTLSFRDYSGTLSATTAVSSMSIAYPVPDTTGPTLNDNELSMQAPIAQIYLSANQNIGSTAATTITFNTVSFDEHGLYSAANNGFIALLTMPHEINLGLNVTGMTADEQFIVEINVNGSQRFRVINRAASAETIFNISRTLELVKGDIVNVEISSTADTSYSVRGGIGDSYLEIKALPKYTVLGAVRNNEYLESKAATANYTITANTYGDLGSLTLSAGEWELNSFVVYYSNGTVTTSTIAGGFSTASGTGTTGFVIGENFFAGTKTTTDQRFDSFVVPNWRVIVTTPTTYYLKSRVGTSITNLQVAYKMAARRIK